MNVVGIPPLVSASQLLGSDQPGTNLQMSVGLAMRNQDQLDALLHDLYDPTSPRYHQFLTVDEFTQQFSPTVGQQQAVVDYLTQQGLTVTQTYPDRLLVDFTGSVSLAEQVFGVTINDYQAPDGRNFFANANGPTLPAYIASDVTFVAGLENATQYKHQAVVAKNAPKGAPLSAGAIARLPAEVTAVVVAFLAVGARWPTLFGAWVGWFLSGLFSRQSGWLRCLRRDHNTL